MRKGHGRMKENGAPDKAKRKKICVAQEITTELHSKLELLRSLGSEHERGNEDIQCRENISVSHNIRKYQEEETLIYTLLLASCHLELLLDLWVASRRDKRQRSLAIYCPRELKPVRGLPAVRIASLDPGGRGRVLGSQRPSNRGPTGLK